MRQFCGRSNTALLTSFLCCFTFCRRIDVCILNIQNILKSQSPSQPCPSLLSPLKTSPWEELTRPVLGLLPSVLSSPPPSPNSFPSLKSGSTSPDEVLVGNIPPTPSFYRVASKKRPTPHFIVSIWVCRPHVCLCTMHMQCLRDQRGYLILGTLVTDGSYLPCRVLGIEPPSSGRAVSVRNQSVISPAPQTSYRLSLLSCNVLPTKLGQRSCVSHLSSRTLAGPVLSLLNCICSCWVSLRLLFFYLLSSGFLRNVTLLLPCFQSCL